ncbi:lycopene cyclase domain-containing protein [Parvicella tangerina]|uniref:Lycopene cyclase domain-containing protein n=1 Tax=Parvicella tangerina TaxID=2829795 RepID=A0A916JQ70_9FLAO|nr:lycopene cyclase domain-containing protein [Parvicella tangerina]CAG5086518.1 hypothetical protein CRYO30217_03155 [Parvicella tangerina]
MQYLYLWIDLFTFLGPLALSFDKKVGFFKNWKRLFLSIGLMMLIFIPWDIAFTVHGVWGFNPNYLSGLEIFHLPIEEWLFFIVVPYATVFIYECCRAYIRDVFEKVARPSFWVIGVILLILGVFFHDRWYTFINFVGAGLIILVMLMTKQKSIGYLMMGFLISLVPFLLVNGVLTGSLLEEPIVWYNNDENLGIRILTIPVEDMFYFLFFYTLVLIPYEQLRHTS